MNKKQQSNSLTLLNVPLLLLGIIVALNASTTVGAQDQPGYKHIKSFNQAFPGISGVNTDNDASNGHFDLNSEAAMQVWQLYHPMSLLLFFVPFQLTLAFSFAIT